MERKLKDSGIPWIGQIPEHWISTKAKYYIEIKSGDSISKEDIVQQGAIPVYGGGEIIGFTSKSNILPRTIVIGRVGARCGCVRLTNIDSWATDNALVVSTSQNPKFLTRVFEGANLNRLNESNAQPLITATTVKDLQIPVPPLHEQAAIADYLDVKCGEIDELIEVEQQMISDLESYRQSVITEAVTHGLNPDAPLRPSGIPWLGQIPEHWVSARLKSIGEARNGLTYTPNDVCDADKGILVLRSSNIQKDSLSFKDNVYVLKRVESLLMSKGDILICARNGSAALVGKCAMITEDIDATFGAFMMRFRSSIHRKFTLYLLRTTLSFYRWLYVTSTINQLTSSMLGSMQIPLPPLVEQQAIADYLDVKCAEIDELIKVKQDKIEALKQYRQSLIFEAVTGKINIA